MTNRVLSVPDVSCQTCKNAIEGALRPLPGVQTTDVDITARTVTVDFDEAVLDRDAVVAAIEERGYQVATED